MVQKQLKGKKRAFSKYDVVQLNICRPPPTHTKKNHKLCPTYHAKIYSKCNKYLVVKLLKLFKKKKKRKNEKEKQKKRKKKKKKIGENLQDLLLGKEFLNLIPKT